jgi:hypothetical protein
VRKKMLVRMRDRLSKAKPATVEPLLRRQWRSLGSKEALREFDQTDLVLADALAGFRSQTP